MRGRRTVYLGFLTALVCGLLLYLPFLSRQWDLNGLYEARAVDAGGAELFLPNHLLYRPLGFITVSLARMFGYGGNSAVALKNLTAYTASIGVGLFWLWIKKLTGSASTASIASLFLATTWAFWVFSTDIYYITPAAATVVGALLLVPTKSPPTYKAVIALGVLVSLSILFWQANVFLIPTVGFALFRQSRERTRTQILSSLGLFMAVVVITVGAAYLAAGTQIPSLSSWRDFIKWASSHSSEDAVSIWGVWSADRVPTAMHTALASFIPIQGLSLKDAVNGLSLRDRLLVGLSLAAFVMLCAITCVGAIVKRADIKPGAANLVWLCLAYGAYIPFIIWWDPFEAKWFVIPNLFLIAALAQVWGVLFVKRGRQVMVGVCVAVIAAANFVHVIWPRHSKPNPNIQLARCFAARASGGDTVVITDWNWSGYAVYFFGYKGREFLLIGGTGDKGVKVQWLLERVEEANDWGGRVYIRDFDTYTPNELAVVASLTGFTPADFDIFRRHHAFSCGKVRFIQLTQIK